MFERFGLKDAFYAIWKHKILIIAVALATGLLGGLALSGNPKRVTGQTVPGQYNETITYYVKLSDKAYQSKGLATSSLSAVQLDYTKSYTAILTSDVCLDYVVASAEEIVGKEKMDKQLRAVNPDGAVEKHQALKNLVKVEQVKDSYLITVSITSVDTDFVKAVSQGYYNYVNQANNDFDFAQLQHIKTVKSDNETLQIREKSNAFSKTGFVKYTVVFGIAGAAVAIIAVMGIALFFPTINRKSDFQMYNVPVLGELPKSKGNRGGV